MRSRSLLALVAVAVAAGSIHAQAPAKVEPAKIQDLSWMAGCWSVSRTNGSTQEFWLPPAGGAMLGLSRTIRNGKMTEYEYLSIREVNGKLSYVAIPSQQKETVFPLVRLSATEAVFENPEHDFPQRLIYRKVADGMTARAEGVMDGKSSGFDFPFKPCT